MGQTTKEFKGTILENKKKVSLSYIICIQNLFFFLLCFPFFSHIGIIPLTEKQSWKKKKTKKTCIFILIINYLIFFLTFILYSKCKH